MYGLEAEKIDLRVEVIVIRLLCGLENSLNCGNFRLSAMCDLEVEKAQSSG